MAEDATNAEVKKALGDVMTAVTSMRADIDALKTPKGRSQADPLDQQRIDAKNEAISKAQDVIDRARKVRETAKATLDRIKAAREARPAANGRFSAGPGGRSGAIRCHLTGKPLTHDQIEARAEYREAFKAWAKEGDAGLLRQVAPKAAMQTQIAEKGGFLVPHEMETAVIQLGGLYSAMRMLSNVRQITMGNHLKQPVNVQGATFGWTGELETRAETDTDDLGMLEWHLMEAYAQPKVTNILLQDAAFDVEGWLNEGITREFAEGEGVAFISGTGVNQPRGIQSYSIVANSAWVWGSIGYIPTGVSNAITDSTHNGYDAMIDAITALHRRYLPGARWMMNRLSEAVIRKVKDGNENYIWQPNVSASQPATILGFPVETDDNVPSANTNTYPIMFGDYGQAYRIVDKPGMSMLRDEVTNKGRTIFYTTKRVGGGVQNYEAVKFIKCAAS
ncbi:MAG: phage major capsid protein [Pseudomonadota bacterium]|nr:phage major capsid protein [Pseudomonadota bacterium]